MIGKFVIIHIISVFEKLNLGKVENRKLTHFTKVNEINSHRVFGTLSNVPRIFVAKLFHNYQQHFNTFD